MSRRALAAAAAALAFTACNSARKLEAQGTVTACTRCHGDPGRQDGAPPRDTRGETATTAVSVGAHQSHLTARHGIAAPVPCEACHAVPAAGAPNHPDGAVQVTFGAVARPNGEAASWNPEPATCSVYCHGSTLPDRAAPPVWTRVDERSDLSCRSCHGFPPPAPHPQKESCHACHPATVTEQGTIDVAGGKHLDGQIEFSLTGCTACHGEAGRAGADPLAAAAPPVGPGGETETTEAAVGAHQAHLVAGNVARPVACAACHAVPASLTHADGVAQVTFGADATRDGSPARWDRESASCASTYCHGATLEGGVATAPVWTRVDGSQRACDSCHGDPPPGHATGEACATCHPGTVGPDGAILVDNGLHVNGRVDVQYHPDGWSDASPDGRWTPHGRAASANLPACERCHGADLAGGSVGISCDGCHRGGGAAWRTDCTFCHGDPNRAASAAAPPAGTQGEVSPGDRAVGAHQQHLAEGPMGRAVACGECHPVPSDMSHVDGARAIAFGALATKDSPAAAWDGARCSATYCHGATLADGTNPAPQWTKVDGTQAACGTCHGLPPRIPAHVGVGADLAGCAGCHGQTMTARGAVIPASQGGKHLDGAVEVSSNHGDGWTDPASPNFHAYSANAGLAACGTCHGADLGGGSGRACASCHGVGFTTTCTGCHGDAAKGTPAPPRATWGNTAPQATGAHASHLGATHGLAAPLDCVACHAKPADALAPGHVDGAPTVTGYTGSDPALAAVVTDPGYARSGAGASCATSYCHGATLLGGTHTQPSWTLTDGTQAACGTCHGRPPLTGPDVGGYPAHKWHTYKQNLACQTCHDGYSQTSVDPATHVNGVRDVRVRHLACVPQGCDPSLDPSCACTEEVATIVGWDCGGCHSKFTF